MSETQAATSATDDGSWLTAIVDGSADAVFMVGRDGTIRSWNRGASEIFGYSIEEIVGRPVETLADGVGQKEMTELFRRVMRGDTVRNRESIRRRKDGSSVHVAVTLTPLRDVRGDVQAVSVILRDVTAQKRAQADEQARAEALAAQALAMKSITDNASLGLVMMDTRQFCTFMNPAAEKILGVTFAEIEKRQEPLHNIVHHTRPDGSPYPISECPIDRALPTRLREHGEDMFVRPDGTFYPLEFTASPISRGGIAVGTILELEDVTQRRADARELKESNERLELLARATSLFMEPKLSVEGLFERMLDRLVPTQGQSAAVMLLTADRRDVEVAALRHADKAAEEHGQRILTGKPLRRQDVLGASVFETGEPLLLPRVGASSFAALSNPELSAYLTLYPIGSYLAVPMRTARGMLGVLGISRAPQGRPFSKADQHLFQDIAERAALALEAASSYADAQDAIRLRDDFLSIASHELRTPLTALLLQLQGMNKLTQEHGLADGARFQKKLDTAIRQTHRMTALVDDLLDVTNLSRGKPRLFREQVELSTLLRETTDKSSEQARKHGCDLRLTASPVFGYWDPRRLEQVFTNLISNAIKYGARGPIEIEVQARGDFAEVSVRDEGIGIDPKLFERIFERFGRGVSSTHYGGLGLGLFIARQIVTAHGGSIHVESEVSKGSIFRVTLPRHAPSSEAQSAEEDLTLESE